MNDLRDLKAIAEACKEHQPLRFMRSHGALYIRNDNGIVFDVHQNRSFPEFMAQNKDYADLVLAANPETILALIAENQRLGLKADSLEFAKWSCQVNEQAIRAARHETIEDLAEERDQLKAENETLRDDLEQNQYDANAWRNGEESVWVEVFNSEGDDPFISAISGQITVEQLALIQTEILEYREDYFEKGSGLYVFRCSHYQAHYDNVGMTEPAHWETDFESYSPFEWAEEAEAMSQAVQP